MDGVDIVVNGIWAFVALCGIVAAFVTFRTVRTSRALEEAVAKLEDAVAGARFTAISANTLASDNKHEIDRIQAGLEKLKAVPPKAPRY